jgi:hypothetical protein
VEVCATRCVFFSLAALAPSYALSARLRALRLLALLLCASRVAFGYALVGLWNYLSTAYDVELDKNGELHCLAATDTAPDDVDYISLVRTMQQDDDSVGRTSTKLTSGDRPADMRWLPA